MPFDHFEQIESPTALADSVLVFQEGHTLQEIFDLALCISSDAIVKMIEEDEYTCASLVFITIPAFASVACDCYEFTSKETIHIAMKEYSSWYSSTVSNPNDWDFSKLASEFKIDIEIHRRSLSLVKKI